MYPYHAPRKGKKIRPALPMRSGSTLAAIRERLARGDDALSGGALPAGTVNWFDITVGRPLDFENLVWMLTPVQVPLLGTYNDPAVGTAPPPPILPQEPIEALKW